MNFFLWKSRFTDNVLMSLKELGIALITPASRSKAKDGDHGNGTLADPEVINWTVRQSYRSRLRPGGSNG